MRGPLPRPFRPSRRRPPSLVVASGEGAEAKASMTLTPPSRLQSPQLAMLTGQKVPGASTSTVTVPLVAALGLGLAETIPGRSVLLDGFGLIAFASLVPIIFVLLFGMVA